MKVARTIGLLLAAALSVGRAAADERRTFSASVDGKPAGSFVMESRSLADGKQSVRVVADVSVRVLFVKHVYRLRATEIWRGGDLVSLDSVANDDGKHSKAQIRDRKGVLTTTGWRAPDGAQEMTAFEVEDGNEIAVRTESLSPADFELDSRKITARRYRVRGKDLDAIWWYDAQGRPLRQEMVWDGHKVVLLLASTTPL